MHHFCKMDQMEAWGSPFPYFAQRSTHSQSFTRRARDAKGIHLKLRFKAKLLKQIDTEVDFEYSRSV